LISIQNITDAESNAIEAAISDEGSEHTNQEAKSEAKIELKFK